MIAELRGDYAVAEERYRQSLALLEEIGDRGGIARSYHQLGMIAELRGDYAVAEERYRQSLALKEEIGDRGGIASSTSQLGVLYTIQGRAADAVPLNLASLALRIEIGSPEVRIDLHWLGRQRETLGESAFRTILTDHLGPGDTTDLLALLDSIATDTNVTTEDGDTPTEATTGTIE
jgi:tetratricopeptide (TPR) repeat protein